VKLRHILIALYNNKTEFDKLEFKMFTGRKGELLLLLGGHIGPGVGGPKSSEIISHQGTKGII